MPQPIIPIHQLNNHNALFERQSHESEAEQLMSTLSTMQSQFLSNPPIVKEAAKYNENAVNYLEAISKEEEELITAANTMVSSGRNGQTYYRVPNTISDAELIGLKTEGLVVGSGRVVAFTERAKVALRDKWLSAENHLKQERTKDGYDHPLRTASTNKFVRTAERQKKIISSQE